MNVGEIFVRVWGYSMTINHAFQVVEVSKTGKTCTVRRIQMHEKSNDCNAGTAFPVPNAFTGPEIKKCRVNGDRICVKAGEYAYKHPEGKEYFFNYMD